MFDIFSVGDSAYLQAVLNAVAMIAGRTVSVEGHSPHRVAVQVHRPPSIVGERVGGDGR